MCAEDRYHAGDDVSRRNGIRSSTGQWPPPDSSTPDISSSSRLLLLDLVVQEHLEDVEAREDLPEDLHLEGVAVRPLHGRHPRVQPLRERDVGLSRRVVRPELLVDDLPAPFLDELPRRDHLPAGALRLVHRKTSSPSPRGMTSCHEPIERVDGDAGGRVRRTEPRKARLRLSGDYDFRRTPPGRRSAPHRWGTGETTFMNF